MTTGVQQARKVRREASPEEAAFLELLRTTDQLSRELVPLLKAEQLSPTQYQLHLTNYTPKTDLAVFRPSNGTWYLCTV